MILVKSSCDDSSTADVLDWIFFCSDEPVIRLNGNVNVTDLSLRVKDNTDWSFKAGGRKIDSGAAAAYWYRRGRFSPAPAPEDSMIRAVMGDSAYEAIDSLNHMLSLCAVNIGNYKDNGLSKIETLIKASAAGLKIPDTLITASLRELNDFCNLHDKIITKPATNSIPYLLPFADSRYRASIISKVRFIDKAAVHDRLNGHNTTANMPSLYQQYIEKKYELRILYIDGQFFAMAIFSQQNERTKMDYRNYDAERPNRCVPYQLPRPIEKKIHALMTGLGLKSGSVDMIYSTQDQYIFLEVNPIGQYQWLEGNCNYPVSKLIAGILTNRTQHGTRSIETTG